MNFGSVKRRTKKRLCLLPIKNARPFVLFLFANKTKIQLWFHHLCGCKERKKEIGRMFRLYRLHIFQFRIIVYVHLHPFVSKPLLQVRSYRIGVFTQKLNCVTDF